MTGARHLRLDELLVGTEGLALLRNLYDGSDEQAATRLSEVRAILEGDREHASQPGELIVESDPGAGYGIWLARTRGRRHRSDARDAGDSTPERAAGEVL